MGKKELSEEQNKILKERGTEEPFSSSLVDNDKEGNYYCVNCGNLLFNSTHKFESGTGWPSFTKPANKDALEYRKDKSLATERTEVICGKCGGHLGHVFPDGPQGKERYCVNGKILNFKENGD